MHVFGGGSSLSSGVAPHLFTTYFGSVRMGFYPSLPCLSSISFSVSGIAIARVKNFVIQSSLRRRLAVVPLLTDFDSSNNTMSWEIIFVRLSTLDRGINRRLPAHYA
jgi:hypothetical protein